MRVQAPRNLAHVRGGPEPGPAGQEVLQPERRGHAVHDHLGGRRGTAEDAPEEVAGDESDEGSLPAVSILPESLGRAASAPVIGR